MLLRKALMHIKKRYLIEKAIPDWDLILIGVSEND